MVPFFEPFVAAAVRLAMAAAAAGTINPEKCVGDDDASVLRRLVLRKLPCATEDGRSMQQPTAAVRSKERKTMATTTTLPRRVVPPLLRPANTILRALGRRKKSEIDVPT
jgi:hypothetical protein